MLNLLGIESIKLKITALRFSIGKRSNDKLELINSMDILQYFKFHLDRRLYRKAAKKAIKEKNHWHELWQIVMVLHRLLVHSNVELDGEDAPMEYENECGENISRNQKENDCLK